MKLSVALCTYNGEKHIKEQLDSILNQTVHVNEIIICDDKSDDNTFKILQCYQEKHPSIFKLFLNERTLRSVKNFEKALSLCTGEITFLCDQDDCWHPNKVEVFTKNFEANPQNLAFCSNGYLMDKNSKVMSDHFPKWDVYEKYLCENKFINNFNFITQKGNFSTGATMAVKTEFAKSTIPFPELENFHHDEWLTLLATAYGKMTFIPEKLINYRVHCSQQVGGIAFAKDSLYFSQIYDYFSFNTINNDFKSIKSRISAQVKWHNNFLIFFKSNTKQYQILKIRFSEEYEKNKNLLKLKFPLKSFFLRNFDKMVNKRQLKN